MEGKERVEVSNLTECMSYSEWREPAHILGFDLWPSHFPCMGTGIKTWKYTSQEKRYVLSIMIAYSIAKLVYV